MAKIFPILRSFSFGLGCLALASCSGSSDPAPLNCTAAVAPAVRSCITEFSEAVATCYESSGLPCADDAAGLSDPLAALAETVAQSCTDGEFLNLSQEALAARLENTCRSEASSIAWRTYGGPQGAVWPKVSDEDRLCLSTAHRTAVEMVGASLDLMNGCLAAEDCATAAVDEERGMLLVEAVAEASAACPDLASLVAVDPQVYMSRAAAQADCVTASAQPSTEGLGLSCGPDAANFTAPRGEYVQVVLDPETTGTLCGDGSPYAFWVRMAPEGYPLDRLLIGLQGGGVCLGIGGDCEARFEQNPGLFTAMDDAPISSGIASIDPDESAFANWTHVYLPYCNQDVFAGGGVVERLGDFSLPRYGGINLRESLAGVRNVLWGMMDGQGGAGYRSDEVLVLFGGFSAGSYGTVYNYSYLPDELLWERTTGFADAGLALDNGEPILGVKGFGIVKIPAWGTLPYLPSYCFEGACALGEVIAEALAPRLKKAPQQQLLMVSNERDLTQQNDAFFESEPFWVNTMRRTVCDTYELNGIHWYLTGVSTESIHVVTIRPELWNAPVDGVLMRDWFERAIFDPDNLQTRVIEGDFVEAVPGVAPYPCDVAG
ncbi:MAG: pectin acetylesterase-family hydrolase [Candidatus Binatia bacterium]|nr:pectin acetylesterase-family hydrolase [Candidatus Binatia bacterium]MDG2011407.1 pectin acetylesterase-family hydrolase [Candidatus Binatia bacterium]